MKTVHAKLESVILVCGKCTRKVGGGFGKKGRRSLVKELRGLSKDGKGRKARRMVIETGCMKVCPKNAVVTIDTARPDRWLIIPAGMATEEVATHLDLPLA